MSAPFLVDLQTNQIISYINKPISCIGRAINYCDIVIDDESVSRSHCDIIYHVDGLCLIRDLNSTNGTSVENTILKPNEEYPLQNRDCLRIGKKSFLFINESDEV